MSPIFKTFFCAIYSAGGKEHSAASGTVTTASSLPRASSRSTLSLSNSHSFEVVPILWNLKSLAGNTLTFLRNAESLFCIEYAVFSSGTIIRLASFGTSVSLTPNFSSASPAHSRFLTPSERPVASNGP